MHKRLYRSRDDRIISGVCGGLGEYFEIDPTIVRLVFVALALLTSGVWILIYIVMAIVVPEAPREGEAAPVAPATGDEFASAGRAFGEDVRAAAHRVTQPGAAKTSGVGRAAAAGGAAAGATVEEGTGAAPSGEPAGGEAPATEGAPAEGELAEGGEPGAAAEPDGPEPPAEPAPAAPTPAPAPAVAPPSRRRPGFGGVLIGVLLVAFGALLLLERLTGIDLFAFGWRVGLPLLVIGLGLLILVRAMQRR